MSKLSEEEARDKVFNDYLNNIMRSVRKARLFYKTTITQLEAQCEALADNCIKHGSEIHQLEERLDAAIDNKTCLIDTKGGSRIRVVGQDLWDNNEELKAKNEALHHTVFDFITAMKTPTFRSAKTTLQMCKILDGWIVDLENALLTKEDKNA
jgi:hypothetical protein